MSLQLLSVMKLLLILCPSLAVAAIASEDLELANAAHSHVMGLACDLTEVTSPAECRDVQALPRSEFRVHLAKPSSWTRYRLKVLQQRRFLHARDGVLVLDPFPRRQFGHLLFVFFLHSRFDRNGCRRLAGTTLANGGCLYPAAIPHCRTSLFWRATHGHPAYRHCEHHFMPLVAHETDTETPHLTQRLACAPLPGFAACPPAYPFSRRPQCPLLADSAVHEDIRAMAGSVGNCPSLTDVTAHCPLEQSCDQAVLVAGGWNPDAGLDSTEAAVARVHAKLRDVGFSAAAVQTFYADRRSSRLSDIVAENLHAAGGMKVAFQQHLQRLCRTDYCLNNLVIYLRSPALLDGSLLLWDFNNDYDVSRDEEYSPEELLADLSQCKARRVVVFLDTNFAERLAEKLRDVPNLAVFAATSKNNYAADSLMSEVFFSNTSHLASPGTLAQEFAQRNGGRGPLMYGVSETSSVFGNGLRDPVTAGCRSLPTSLIIRRMAAAAHRRRR